MKPQRSELCRIMDLSFGEHPSLLKNFFALSSVPGSAAKYNFIVVFRPCF